jgi:hypothetical protein
MYQNFIILYLYEVQHVSGDTPPIIRNLKLHWQPLVFHTWKIVGRVDVGICQALCAWQRPPPTRPTTFHVWKTRGCQCSFRLLMMGGVSPETCWASYKYGIIKFWYILASCWIFLYEFYKIQCKERFSRSHEELRVLLIVNNDKYTNTSWQHYKQFKVVTSRWTSYTCTFYIYNDDLYVCSHTAVLCGTWFSLKMI